MFPLFIGFFIFISFFYSVWNANEWLPRGDMFQCGEHLRMRWRTYRDEAVATARSVICDIDWL